MPDIKLDGRVSIIRDKATNDCTIRYYAQDDFVIDTIVTTWSKTLSDSINQYDWQEGDDIDFIHFYKGASVTIEGELNKLFEDFTIIPNDELSNRGIVEFCIPKNKANEKKLDDLITQFHPTLVFFGYGICVTDSGLQLESVVKIKEQ
jgi:hypothetical protein